MSEPPIPPDPSALTQPLVVVSQPLPEPPTSQAVPSGKTKPTYAPTFGNIGTYAFTRFVALLIDFVLVPFSFACFFFNMADRGSIAFAPRTAAGFDSIAGLAFAAALVFAFLFESIFETTVGKALFGLGVRRGTGQHAGPQRIFVRYLLLPVDLLAIGAILALVTRRHQRLGDFVAGTVVARHRIGGFITVAALAIFAGLIYAQATVGGGLTSILAVTAEATYFIPPLVGGALANVGLVPRPSEPAPLPTASPQALPEATDAPASPDPAQTT